MSSHDASAGYPWRQIGSGSDPTTTYKPMCPGRGGTRAFFFRWPWPWWACLRRRHAALQRSLRPEPTLPRGYQKKTPVAGLLVLIRRKRSRENGKDNGQRKNRNSKRKKKVQKIKRTKIKDIIRCCFYLSGVFLFLRPRAALSVQANGRMIRTLFTLNNGAVFA